MSNEQPRPARYLHGHHGSVLESHAARTAENSCAYLLPHLEPGMRVLDVGCGPGSITLDLAAVVGERGRVIGLDPSSAAIETARDAAVARGDRLTVFEVGDLFAAEHASGVFDVVHAHQVLQHLADPVGALRAMAGLVRPGGIVAVRDADYSAMAWYPRVPGLDDWRDLYARLAREAGGEPDAARHMRAWANAAGFAEASVTASTWLYATEASTSWWGRSWAERAMSSAFAARALEGRHATRDDLERIRDAWLEFAEHPDAWFSMVHGEVLARV